MEISNKKSSGNLIRADVRYICRMVKKNNLAAWLLFGLGDLLRYTDGEQHDSKFTYLTIYLSILQNHRITSKHNIDLSIINTVFPIAHTYPPTS